jgi:hypothetical protein
LLREKNKNLFFFHEIVREMFLEKLDGNALVLALNFLGRKKKFKESDENCNMVDVVEGKQ